MLKKGRYLPRGLRPFYWINSMATDAIIKLRDRAFSNDGG